MDMVTQLRQEEETCGSANTWIMKGTVPHANQFLLKYTKSNEVNFKMAISMLRLAFYEVLLDFSVEKMDYKI